MSKFQKTYRMMVQYPYPDGGTPQDSEAGQYLEIDYPMTLEFAIDRTAYADANSANLRIYNLSKEHREKMFRDRMQMAQRNDTDQYVNVYAGYQSWDNLSLMFKGVIWYGHSTRRGPDIVTELECQDPAPLTYSKTLFKSLNKNTSMSIGEVIRVVFSEMNIKNGYIGESLFQIPYIVKDKTSRGQVLAGKGIDVILNQVLGNYGYFHVDNGIPRAMGHGDILINPTYQIIDSSWGLINVPTKSLNYLSIPLMFSPQLQVSQLIDLRADNRFGYGEYNGSYKIVGVHHRGIISSTHDAQTMTTIDTQIWRAK
jgi:hypothetical protein